jgi:hypothetical protein
MPRRILDRDEDLQLDLRQGHLRRQLRPVVGGPAIAFPGPRPDSRHAIVKVWGASPGTTGRHVRYLTHGKGTDGTDTTLFTAEGYTLTARPFIEQAHHDPHQYRLVVSLPDAGDLSLRRFVQAWMGHVSRDLWRPIDYVAAVHRDTAHTHVHVVLRGRDQDGHRLILPRRYLTHGLRYRAMFLATAWLGPVPEPERSTHAQLAREVETAMDAQMREAKKEDGMEDHDQDRLSREIDPQPSVPDSAPLSAAPEKWQSLIQRLEQLLSQRHQAREQDREHGMGL